jgi:hypothetical protein
MLRTLVITCFLTVSALLAIAQQSHDPLSSFGFGEFLDNTQSAVAATGWNQSVFNDYRHVNLTNAASYASLQSTTFELGLYAQRNLLANSTQQIQSWKGNVNSVSLAFPMFSPLNEALDRKKRILKWGMGIGLSQFARTDFNYRLDYKDTDAGAIYQQHDGNGGYYKIHWNNGLNYKGLTLGVGAAYLFGKVTKNSTLTFLDISQEYTYNTNFITDVALNGFIFNFSGMYSFKLNPMTNGKETDPSKLKKITIGAYLNPATNIKARQTKSLYSTVPFFGTTDTLYNEVETDSRGKFIMENGFGIQYNVGEKLELNANYAGISFNNTSLLDYKNAYTNSALYSFGAEFSPNPYSLFSFFKRVKYRAGFRTGTQPLTIDGTQTRLTAGIVGIGVPVYVNRQISFINLGVEAGKKEYGRGYSDKYINISLSLNLNDDYWFMKRKYN